MPAFLEVPGPVPTPQVPLTPASPHLTLFPVPIVPPGSHIWFLPLIAYVCPNVLSHPSRYLVQIRTHSRYLITHLLKIISFTVTVKPQIPPSFEMSIVLSELHFPFYNILKEKARIPTTRMLSQHQLTAAWLHSVLPGWNAGLEKNFKLTTIYLGISLNIVLHPPLPFHFISQELAILFDFFYRKQSKRYREFMWSWDVQRTYHSTCFIHVLCGSLLSFIHLLLRVWWPKLIHS